MKPQQKLKLLHDKWFRTRQGAALLMTIGQHIYFETGEIMLRLQALKSEKLYKKHIKFRKALVGRVEQCRLLLDKMYTDVLNVSTPLVDLDNSQMEMRGEIKRRAK